MSDAFTPPEESDGPAKAVPVKRQLEPGELPTIGDLFNETIEDFTENIAGYALAGLGLFIVTFIVVFVAIFVLYGGMAAFMIGGVAVGAAVGGDGGGVLAMLISIGGMMLTMVAFMGVLMGIILPVQTSLERAVRDHINGEGELGITAAFSTITQDLPKVFGLAALLLVATMLGLCAFYVGALVAGFLFYWALPLVALNRKGPMDAMTLSAKRITGDFGGVGVLTILCLLLNIVAAYVPIVGPMFGISLRVRLHQAMFQAESAA